MNPRAEAYTKSALELIGTILIELILYIALDDTPSLHEFCITGGPAVILCIRNLMKRSPRDVWNGNERRKEDVDFDFDR